MSLRLACRTALIAVALLLLAGCDFDLSSIDPDCTRVSSNVVTVGKDQSCKFRFGTDKWASYKVVVTRPPANGIATGEGRSLRYAARPGFTGEDILTIRVERWVFGNVQWEMRRVKVTVTERGQNLKG